MSPDLLGKSLFGSKDKRKEKPRQQWTGLYFDHERKILLAT